MQPNKLDALEHTQAQETNLAELDNDGRQLACHRTAGLYSTPVHTLVRCQYVAH
jgi:hypothetical protein